MFLRSHRWAVLLISTSRREHFSHHTATRVRTMPCPSLWRQKWSPHVSTVPGAGSTWPPTHRAPTPPRGYTDESPRGSTAESDSRWQFPITVAFPIPRALSTLQRGRWNVPAHHHATVGRHGHTRTVVPSRRTVRDLDDQLGGGDRPRRSGQPTRGSSHL